MTQKREYLYFLSIGRVIRLKIRTTSRVEYMMTFYLATQYMDITEE